MKRMIRTYEVVNDISYEGEVVYRAGERITDPMISNGYGMPFSDGPMPDDFRMIGGKRTVGLNRMGSVTCKESDLRLVDEIVHHGN